METEDKYEQALARASEFYNAARLYDFTDDMKKFEYIFPELCEKPQQVLMVASSINHDDDISLWSIADAKPGDVLATKWGAFIFKEYLGSPNSPNGIIAYCGINSMGRFDNCDGIPWTDEKITPATKEQRGILFKKMHEAGYEWDDEKKELSKKSK